LTETFRVSEFVDFNTGTVKIAPMKLWFTLSPPLQLADKIRLFHCRVDVWNLGVAAELLRQIESHQPPSIWSHAAYGLISVGFSYFEMIGKTINPDSKKSGTAGKDFNFGFCDVYPEFIPSSRSYDDSDMPVVKEFRNRVRNGMYHLAYTKRNLLIHNNPSVSRKDFDVIQRSDGTNIVDVYCVNPHSMIRTIVDHFPGFIARLNDADAKYYGMRQKFEEFFDDFHDV